MKPKPSKTYQTSATELADLLERNENPERRRVLRKKLRQRFMSGFKLKPDRLKVAERLYDRFIRTALRPQGDVPFEHKDFFRRDGKLVIASQPYGFDRAELERWATDVGAKFTVANEWGFYYPGRASLFWIEFTPEAKAKLDARLRKSCN